jgi:hypothetical protein
MSSSSYDSKTYSFIDLNTVRFTESQAKNDKIFKNSNARRVLGESKKRVWW